VRYLELLNSIPRLGGDYLAQYLASTSNMPRPEKSGCRKCGRRDCCSRAISWNPVFWIVSGLPTIQNLSAQTTHNADFIGDLQVLARLQLLSYWDLASHFAQVIS
jgi:hypothetical protein